LHRSGWGT